MTTWALDLDGVIWTGKNPIVGSSEAVARLIERNHEVVFVTNNSFSTIDQQEAKLASFGIDARGRVLNSSQAAAALVSPEESVFVLGGPGVSEAMIARGVRLVADYRNGDPVPDAVVVGLDWDLSYERLRAAAQAIRAGARFVATNTDNTYPTEQGLFPGAGALVAAVAAGSGVEPIVAGKPASPAADLVRERFGTDGIMVGDRPDTDGLFAKSLGYRFGLVLSGVTLATDLPTDPVADAVALNLAEMVEQLA